MRPLLFGIAISALLGTPTGAWTAVGKAQQLEKKKDEEKKAEKPDLGPMRTIEFDTDEGTWMNLDVSPDGKTILFDLLGDIYTLPLEGGEAKLLLGGRDWDQMPRWSPDGKQIAFVSDRDGANMELWVADADGKNVRQVSR